MRGSNTYCCAVLTIALLTLGTVPASAQQETDGLLSNAFPYGEEACFGRAYDAAHLVRHPRQAVASLHLFKSLTPDPQKEEVQLDRARQAARDRKAPLSTRSVYLSVLVRLKGKRGLYGQEVECQGTNSGSFACDVECDGGMFSAVKSGNRLRLDVERLRVGSLCDPDDEGKATEFSGGPFLLEPLPASACHAQRKAAAGDYLRRGSLLRVRFAKRSDVCHARVYNAPHLARHPQQRVVAISVRTVGRAEVKKDDEVIHTNLEVQLSVKLRDGRIATRTVQCRAHEYTFACGQPAWQFRLARAGDGRITVRALTAGPDKNFLDELTGLDLGQDDRFFRLDEQENPAVCDLR